MPCIFRSYLKQSHLNEIIMKASFRIFATLFLTAILFASCQTARKYVESGNYDDAIDLCLSKLRGKEKKKDEYVKFLELAFKKAQSRDLATISALRNENSPSMWERIHDLHLDIRDRQNKVSPLIPLVSKDGYKARFEFVDIGKLEAESRAKAAETLYDRAVALLKNAANGDKLAARQAYKCLLDLGARYYRNYRDTGDLMAKARDLGTSFVLLEIKNESGKVLPRDFSDRLLSMSKAELDSEWKEFFFDARPGEQFDYKAVFKIQDISISPERVSERAYIDEKTIEDGWEYVLDQRGNVMKDTAGNDIKKKRYATIRAHVLEVHQTKAARLGGFVEIVDLNRKTLVDSRNLGTEIHFEHFAATFRGDERALSQDSRNCIGSSPMPFPRDEAMLVQAAERLKPGLRNELRGSRAIL